LQSLLLFSACVLLSLGLFVQDITIMKSAPLFNQSDFATVLRSAEVS